MLTCYLDDSDATTSSVQTIAGYVGDANGWDRFEALANQVCDTFDVDVIHCREFDARQSCFKGWSVPRSIAFLHAIGDAMAGNVLFGVSRSIPKSHYKRRKSQLNLNPNLGAYGFAFGTIVFSMRHGKEFGIQKSVETEGMLYRIESGHKNNADLERYISSEVQHGNLHPSTMIEFVRKTSSRAIQIADLYAFYSRKRAHRWFKTKGRVAFFPDVWSLHVQNKLPHHTGIIEEPYTSATNLRTGEEFHISGLVKPL